MTRWQGCCHREAAVPPPAFFRYQTRNVSFLAQSMTITDIDLTDSHAATVVAQAAGYVGNFTLGSIADSARTGFRVP